MTDSLAFSFHLRWKNPSLRILIDHTLLWFPLFFLVVHVFSLLLPPQLHHHQTLSLFFFLFVFPNSFLFNYFPSLTSRSWDTHTGLFICNFSLSLLLLLRERERKREAGKPEKQKEERSFSFSRHLTEFLSFSYHFPWHGKNRKERILKCLEMNFSLCFLLHLSTLLFVWERGVHEELSSLQWNERKRRASRDVFKNKKKRKRHNRKQFWKKRKNKNSQGKEGNRQETHTMTNECAINWTEGTKNSKR